MRMGQVKKKLIEVALPLDAINAASAREKSIRHGHPSTLHLWWARRPLAAARAVIFAQMVDDPSGWPDLFPAEEDQERERRRRAAGGVGGADGGRTHDLQIANLALSQLSYGPTVQAVSARYHPSPFK